MRNIAVKYNQPEQALELIGGKWKMPILWRLHLHTVLRYSQLKRDLGTITHKMLSQQLKELENAELISRTAYPVVPPKVEYRLTDKGQQALPVIQALCSFYTTVAKSGNQDAPVCCAPYPN